MCSCVYNCILSSSVKLVVYPYIPKYLGYRKTLQTSQLIFGVLIALLPLVNRITGPIPEDSETDGSGQSGLWSGSGSGSGFWTQQAEMNSTFDYCGNNITEDPTVHDDPIKRIPFYVWVTLVLFLSTIIITRYTFQMPSIYECLHVYRCSHPSIAFLLLPGQLASQV